MKLWILAMSVIALTACGSADDQGDLFGQKVCVPGATTECACPGGAKGAQACRSDGAGYEACQCAGGSGGSAGAGGNGTDGGVCRPVLSCPMPTPGDGSGSPIVQPPIPPTNAAVCGQISDGCGGSISCECAIGSCAGGACPCWQAKDYNRACADANPKLGKAIQCSRRQDHPSDCNLAPTPSPGTYPSNWFCCP